MMTNHIIEDLVGLLSSNRVNVALFKERLQVGVSIRHTHVTPSQFSFEVSPTEPLHERALDLLQLDGDFPGLKSWRDLGFARRKSLGKKVQKKIRLLWRESHPDHSRCGLFSLLKNETLASFRQTYFLRCPDRCLKRVDSRSSTYSKPITYQSLGPDEAWPLDPLAKHYEMRIDPCGYVQNSKCSPTFSSEGGDS